MKINYLAPETDVLIIRPGTALLQASLLDLEKEDVTWDWDIEDVE